ncbi:DUF6801 domain-containing protein [Streptomyces sp. NPDC004237]|uniref:DUF6801 domain-containing protein n=1 Tax=Streptomyces sp. NPDC004237 TaxID=3154455 RepID=UPI0033B889F4
MSVELPTGPSSKLVDLRRRTGLRTASWSATALGTALALVLAAGAGSVRAASATVRFSCTFPGLGTAPMTATIRWDAPDTYTVGRATPKAPVEATTTVDALVPQWLRIAGASSIQGSAEAATEVTAPGPDLDRTVALDIPVTQLPPSGPLPIEADGAMPSLRFSRAGTAQVVVGTVNLHLTPRRADGGTTPLGTVNATCGVGSGQSGVVTTLRIRPEARPGPTATGPGSGSGSGSASGSGSGSGGGSGSGSGTSAGGAGSGSGAGGSGASGASGAGRGSSGRPGSSGAPGPSRTAAPSGSASASGPASASASAVPRGAPTAGAAEASSGLRTSAQDRTPLPAWLRAAAGVLAVAAVAFGSAMWFRRRRGADG